MGLTTSPNGGVLIFRGNDVEVAAFLEAIPAGYSVAQMIPSGTSGLVILLTPLIAPTGPGDYLAAEGLRG